MNILPSYEHLTIFQLYSCSRNSKRIIVLSRCLISYIIAKFFFLDQTENLFKSLKQWSNLVGI